jgi:hypothetical protein
MVGKRKNRKRAAEHLKNRNMTLQRQGMEIATF